MVVKMKRTVKRLKDWYVYSLDLEYKMYIGYGIFFGSIIVGMYANTHAPQYRTHIVACTLVGSIVGFLYFYHYLCHPRE